jgi:hypothetical protein
MEGFRQAKSADTAMSQRFNAPQVDVHASNTSCSRRPRWVIIVALAAILTATAWAIGYEAVRRIEGNDIMISSRRQEPLPGFPKSAKADVNRIVIANGWVGNLRGDAAAYDAEADNLVDHDGRFRLNLSAYDAARLLSIDPRVIAKTDSPHEIDETAPLFRVQVGTLTAESRQSAIKRRIEQLAKGEPPYAASGNWDVREFVFTLAKIKHPTDEESRILSAISKSALCTVPKPGDTIRAVAVNRGDLEPGKIALAPGMLPPEEPMTRAAIR